MPLPTVSFLLHTNTFLMNAAQASKTKPPTKYKPTPKTLNTETATGFQRKAALPAPAAALSNTPDLH